MTREVYDRLCATLTSYEHPEETPDWFNIDWKEEFYLLLVDIQNDSEYT